MEYPFSPIIYMSINIERQKSMEYPFSLLLDSEYRKKVGLP